MRNKIILQERGKDPLYKTWHTTKRTLFMYVHAGTGSVVTKDRTYPIEKNALFLIKPGTYHYTMPDRPDDYVRSKLLLSSGDRTQIESLLSAHKDLQQFFDHTVIYAQIPQTLNSEIEHIFSEAATCSDEDGDALLILSCALRLLFYLNKYAAESVDASAGFMNKAIHYINNHISLELDLDNICAAANMSKYHFCRQFKAQLGMTVMQYVLNTRITLAKEELENTAAPISQISEKFGFSSISYFCQAFKAETGFTPMQYRKHQKTL